MKEYTRPLECLTDDQLLAETKRLVACERLATAAVLRSLMEIDARRLYLREGCSSLFTYCTQVLHLAESAAYNRIEAARATRRFPEVLVALEDGALTLTAVRLLAPHFTADNHRELIARARHKSKRDVELLVAALAPRAAVATVVRRVAERPKVPVVAAPALSPTRSGTEANGTTDPEPPRATAGPAPVAATTPFTVAQPSRPAQSVKPLSPAHYRLQVTLSEETHAKLRRARDLLRHAVPDGDISIVLDRALTLLVADLERRRCAATLSPRSSGAAKGHGRHVPAAVKRAEWTRDQGRCASLGDVQVLPQKTRLVAVARVRFAGLYPRQDHFMASFALRRWLADPRIVKTVDYGPRWRAHFVRITSAADLDDELRAWLQESHDIVGIQSDLAARRGGRAKSRRPR